MLKFSIEVVGYQFKNLEKDLKRQVSNIEKNMEILGRQTVDVLRNNIKTSIKRKSSGKLGSVIDMTLIPSAESITLGIGKISTLNALTPYWYVLNYGARFPGTFDAPPGAPYVPPVTRGSFDGKPAYPDGSLSESQRNQEWSTRSNGKYYMVPKKAIRPSNYIEKTASWLSNYWDVFWANK